MFSTPKEQSHLQGTRGRHSPAESSGDLPRSRHDTDAHLPRYVEPDSPQYVNAIFSREDRISGTASAASEHQPPPRRAGASQELSTQLALHVGLNQFQKCAEFFRHHPEILRERDLRAKYVDPAVIALQKADMESKAMAFSYMEKFVIITAIQSQEDFLHLLLSGDAEVQKHFKVAFLDVKGECEEKTRARLLVPPTRSRHESRQQELDEVTSLMSGTGMSRVDSADTVTPTQNVVSANGDRHALSLDVVPAREDRHAPPQSVASTRDILLASGASGKQTLSEPRFQKLAPHEWKNYFKPGRVFAIKAYNGQRSQPDGERDDYSVEAIRTTLGSSGTARIRRMLTVKTREGFCLAVPINTYGGSGLKKRGLRESNINAHARIFMSDQKPTWLDGEPRTAKRDIRVEPEDRSQMLHPASRICFERTHSVDYNEMLMKIGTVKDQACLRYLEQYWAEESNRPSGHGTRPRNIERQGRAEAARTGMVHNDTLAGGQEVNKLTLSQPDGRH